MAREPDRPIEPQGDRCLIVVLGEHIDAELNRRAQAIAENPVRANSRAACA